MRTLPDTKITLRDKEYSIRFTNRALLKIERELGKSIMVYFSELEDSPQEATSLQNIYILLLAGLNDQVKDMDELIELTDDMELTTLYESVINALTASILGDSPKNVKSPAKKTGTKQKTTGK